MTKLVKESNHQIRKFITFLVKEFSYYIINFCVMYIAVKLIRQTCSSAFGFLHYSPGKG